MLSSVDNLIVVVLRSVGSDDESSFGVVEYLALVALVKLQSRSPLGVWRHSQNIPRKSFLHEHEKSSTPSTHFPPFAQLLC